MQQIILFEDKKWSHFLPLVYTRPVGALRIGMSTIAEKYTRLFDANVCHETRPYLRALFPPADEQAGLRINARLIPDAQVKSAIESLLPGQTLKWNETTLATNGQPSGEFEVAFTGEPLLLENVTDLFMHNAKAISLDFEERTKGKLSEPLHDSNVLIGPADRLFISPGVTIYASSINTLDGPVFIDAGAEIMEGSHIRGPFYLGEHSTLKMASKIYGPTTIGPHCKIGGEVSNCVIAGYSNKAHDGFIGNSVIGEWCNLGADTNTSNLKNNYSKVKTWSYTHQRYEDTGLTFCGLLMGDHSKCGINTMFNTGTVVGVSANIFGGSFPPKHIPSFTWGGNEGFEEYSLTKSLETAARVMSRRSIDLTAEMTQLLTEIFNHTMPQRNNPTQSQD
jgi:UDP-N-acetylglucosamine diphosphorylase/glucosamine-1-phosphate N-acetyltransferase